MEVPIPTIGSVELLIIVGLVLMLFGPERLMEISRTVGRGTREVRRALSDIRRELEDATDVEKREDR